MFHFLNKLFTPHKLHQLQAENERLKADRKQLIYLMENLPHNVYFKDVNGCFTRINQSQAHTLGLTNPEDAIGKTDFDFFAEDHAKQTRIDEDMILKTGKPIVGKVEHIRHALSGELIWVTTSKSPILDENNAPIGIVGVTVNITDKIEAEKELKIAKEKAEESSKLKSAFLANMSHEIRTPMNGIIGFSQLLRNAGTDKEEIGKYVDHISNCGNSLLGIIENIIDISKLVSGQLNVEIAPTQLNVIMDQVYNEYTTTKKELLHDDITFELEKGSDDADFMIDTDARRLKQILIQLLDNAFKFTAKGFIKFGYTANGSSLTFFVKDSGVGISKDKFELIFDNFGQVIESNSVKPKGTGLGLAISSKLVELLGGKIWLESEPGDGSLFYFTLPFEPIKLPERSNTNGKKSIENTPDWKDKSILVAEDEELNFVLIQELLRESNAHLLWAKNGKEALEMLDRHPVDLVLMDLKMPVMDGHQAIKIIKSSHSNLPIIAQTAHAMSEEKEQVLKLGCDAYIVKPLDIDKLVAVMQCFLKS